MMVAQGGFDKKEEVENPSEVLLNPSDPEATFRYKAGGRHPGYVGNVVEAVGEKAVWSLSTITSKIPTQIISL